MIWDFSSKEGYIVKFIDNKEKNNFLLSTVIKSTNKTKLKSNLNFFPFYNIIKNSHQYSIKKLQWHIWFNFLPKSLNPIIFPKSVNPVKSLQIIAHLTTPLSPANHQLRRNHCTSLPLSLTTLRLCTSRPSASYFASRRIENGKPVLLVSLLSFEKNPTLHLRLRRPPPVLPPLNISFSLSPLSTQPPTSGEPPSLRKLFFFFWALYSFFSLILWKI